MTSRRAGKARKIRIGSAAVCAVAAVCVAGVLAGCAHPADTNATTGRASGVGFTDAACPKVLDLSLADNGGTRCVRLDGEVDVNLNGPDGLLTYPGIDQTGSSLTIVAAPFPEAHFAFEATSRGITVITSPGPSCSTSDAVTTCPPGPPWSVTVSVR